MKALVVANGEPPSVALVGALAADAHIVAAADGGGDIALAHGIVPDAVIGDLDSLSADARARLGSQRLVEDTDPNHTDLEKAIRWAIGRGARRVDVVAGGGGRANHALANLSVLLTFGKEADVHLVDDRFDIRRVDGSAVVDAPEGTVVSLVAIGTCAGVTTSGLRWDLHGRVLEFSPFGVHNEVRERPALVTVESGDLLLFEGRWVEHHR